MTNIKRFYILAAAAVLLSAGPVMAEDLVKTPVEVWRAANDDLTSRFAESMAKSLGESPAFQLAHRNEGAVKVQINAVTATGTGANAPFNFTVEITPKGQPVVKVSGNCVDGAMDECTSYLVDKTYAAIKRAPPIVSPPQ